MWGESASGWASARLCTRGDFSPTDAVDTLGSLGFSLAGLLSLRKEQPFRDQKTNISIKFTRDGEVSYTFHYSPKVVCFYSLRKC